MSNPYPEFDIKKHVVNLKLGDKVSITHTLRRVRQNEYSRWEPILLDKPIEGMITGRRTLQNGAWGYEESTHYGTAEMYDPGDYEWQTTDKIEYFKAYLVTYDINRIPMRVLPEHITKLYSTTIQTHHFDPSQPDVDTIHTFGSTDNGISWELIGEERVLGVSAQEMSEAVLDMLVGDAQEDGDYE